MVGDSKRVEGGQRTTRPLAGLPTHMLFANQTGSENSKITTKAHKRASHIIDLAEEQAQPKRRKT